MRFESQPRRPGEDLTRAIDLGTFGGSFSISREVEGYEYYLLDYGLTGDTYHDESGRDVFFRFRLTVPMEVTLDHEGSSGASFTTRLLTAEGDTLEPATHYELMPGEYYVYSLSWQYMKPCLTINLAGTAFATGSDSRWPVELGNFDAGFSCTASCDTRRTLHAHSNDKPGKEAYFRLALSVPMELWMDNCGSEVQDTYLAVRPEAGGAAHEADTGGCDYPEQAALHIPALMPGSYIVMADGATDGEITLNVRGETLGEPGGLLLTAIDAGTHAGGFFFTDTRNTAQGYTDSYGGAANDVFYRFGLADSLAVAVHHEGSELEDTRLTLLASDGESVLYSTNGTGQARIEAELPAGVYYAVSEGATGNGILVTNIEGLGESGPLSPSKDRLYTLYTVPTEETEASDDPGAGQARRTVQYHDGFGLPAMKAEQGVSPYGGLLYTFQEQDPLNRPAGDWLPVPLHGTEGAYVDPGVLAAQAKASSLYGEDDAPFARTVYDGSSLDEATEQYGPGEDWHDAGRSVKTERTTNRSSGDTLLMARKYSVAGDSLRCEGFYETGTLDVTRTTDEDGNTGYEFKDPADGRTLLSRQVNVKKAADGTEAQELLDTYTVYDNYGNIRFVLPPLAADEAKVDGTYDASDWRLQMYIYVYRYDARNRCVYKKLPDNDPVYTVYDGADRAIFTQDGVQRAKGEWSFSIPDAFGRTVLTGTCKNVMDYASNPLDTMVVKATWANETNSLKGYTVTGVSLNAPAVQQANYYDTYDFLGLNGIPNDATTAYAQTTGYGERYGTDCKGYQTGSWTAKLGGNNAALYSVSYYDERYRLVQQRGIDAKGNPVAACTEYSFTGQPLKVRQTRGSETEVFAYTYDNADRLLTATYSLNGATPVTLADNVYDEVGRLVSERRNGNAKLKTDYAYNLRSWVTGINGALFCQTLRYQEDVAGNTPCFNGNIASMTWKAGEAGTEKGYRFAYDNLSRMTDAIYGEGGTLASNANRFNEQVTDYDKHGNI